MINPDLLINSNWLATKEPFINQEPVSWDVNDQGLRSIDHELML